MKPKDKEGNMAYENNTGLPSVTNILSPYIDKRWFTDESRDRGTAVHAACESHLKGLYVPKLNPTWQLYVDSFKFWADKAIDKIILLEVRMRDDRLRFCGQPDAVVVLRGWEYPVLIDWKTSQAAQRWWILQINSYRKLAEVNGLKTICGFSCRLKSDGSGCLLCEYGSKDVATTWNLFLGLLNSYYFFK